MIVHVLLIMLAAVVEAAGWAGLIWLAWWAVSVCRGRYDRDRPAFGAVDLRDWLAHCAPQLDGYGPWRQGGRNVVYVPEGWAAMSGAVDLPTANGRAASTFHLVAEPLRVDIERGSTRRCSHPALQRAVRELRAVR